MSTPENSSQPLFPNGLGDPTNLRDTLDGMSRNVGTMSPVDVLHNLAAVPNPLDHPRLRDEPCRMRAIEIRNILETLVGSAVGHSVRFAVQHKGLCVPRSKEIGEGLERAISWPVCDTQRATLRNITEDGHSRWEFELVDVRRVTGGLVRSHKKQVGDGALEECVVYDCGEGEEEAHIGQLAVIKGLLRSILLTRQRDRVKVSCNAFSSLKEW